jgi:hypothetical protein
MARERTFLFALNGGLVSPLALARTDLQRMRLTAETFHNCFPRVIGPLQFRQGLEYLGSTNGDAAARQIPFIFSVDDTAIIELADLSLRVLVDNEEVSRVAVSTTITNGDFSSGTGWTLTTTGGGVANINSTVAGALVLQTPARGGTSKCERSFSVSAGDQPKEHAIRLTVTAGTVRFRLGSTSGGQEILAEAEYAEGVHSIAFTPNVGTCYIQLSAKSETIVSVASIEIEAAGTLTLTTPWGAADLPAIRYEQSGDVVFVADGSSAPYRIERRGGPTSWSLVKYKFRNGPWRGKTANVTLTPSARLGNGTLTASAPFFTPEHVGALFRLTHTQSTVDVSLAGNDQYTDTLRISGVDQGNTRTCTISVSGTWSGTWSEQVSYDDGETWTNYVSYAVNSGAYNRSYGSDNVTVLARIGFQAGDYTSGVANISLSQLGGGGTGVVRITGYTSATSVTYEVVERLHHTGATENWEEGKFSELRGWPDSVALFESRLWWGSRDQVAGSYVDDFTNFDVEEEGDSAPIIRSIATGPVNKVQWMLGLARLIIGTSGAESVARSSSFDEPMSPTNFSIKDASTYGSADLQAVKIDREGYFIQRSRKRAYVLSYSVEANDYVSQEISRFNPTVLNAGVTACAVQRIPDTRIWNVMDDGSVVCLTYEKSEDVIAWTTFETDGLVEDVMVLPNTDGDDVYFIVNRTIDGVTKRYRERLTYDTDAMGGVNNYMADSFKAQTITASATVSGLDHLEDKDVVVWAAGEPLLDENNDPATFTVSGGSITLPEAVTGTVIVGLPYEGRWKSTKLAYAAQTGTAMSQRKTIGMVAPILYATHNKAALFGSSFTGNMDPINQVFEMEDLGADMLDMDRDYDYDAFALPGEWSPDARLCMKFRAPLPATVLGVGLSIEAHENA